MGGLNKKGLFSQFWRLKVQDQGVGRVDFWETARPVSASLSLPDTLCVCEEGSLVSPLL